MSQSQIANPALEQTAPKALVAADIHKAFGQVAVLKGLSMAANQGDVISILGASGSGKSTFLRCINLLEMPDAGTITVHGETLHIRRDRRGRGRPADARQVERIRTRLGMVFQSFNLWAHMAVLENITEAPIHVLKVPRREAVERAEALLQKVGMYERRHYYPAHISGGQQQRAAIARALAMEPTVMLFDEPTSALDPELVGGVLKVMGELAAEGRTMIVVTHEMAFAREVSSHVVFLHQGQVEEAGSPAKVFDDPDSSRCRQFLGGLAAHR
ncbi:MAG: ABC transporter ATP-binding protein [Candidatus Competibacterales bacterium]